MMRDKRLKEFFQVVLPTRTEPGEAGRAEIENAGIRCAPLRKGRVLQRALYVCPGTNAEEAKRCGRGSGNLPAVVLELVKRRTMAHSPKQLVKRVPKRVRRALAAQSAKSRVKLTECGMREMRFRCVAHFEMVQMTQRNVKLSKLSRNFGLTDLSTREVRSLSEGEAAAAWRDRER
jgi:hypothetical protein